MSGSTSRSLSQAQLQADALITLDGNSPVKDLVTVAPIEALS